MEHIIMLFLDSEQYQTAVLETPPSPSFTEQLKPFSNQARHWIPHPFVSKSPSPRLQTVNTFKQETPSHSNTTLPLHSLDPSLYINKHLFQSRGIDVPLGRVEGSVCVESSSQCRLPAVGDPAGTEDGWSLDSSVDCSWCVGEVAAPEFTKG